MGSTKHGRTQRPADQYHSVGAGRGRRFLQIWDLCSHFTHFLGAIRLAAVEAHSNSVNCHISMISKNLKHVRGANVVLLLFMLTVITYYNKKII